ncbi:MAG TPA: HAD family phosphatase [Polyangiaceae bacterium]|nr:HAD family phosphatase [Polyangiaceae bacterium]
MRAREPEAVIFDMDGVIIDSQAAANRALVEAAAKHGVRLAVSELEDLVGASAQQFWHYVKERYRLPESIPYYAASYDENSEIAGYDETLLSPGLDALLNELRAAGISTALATSGSRRRMNAVIDMYGLARWLDVALCGEDAAREKPAPELFLAAASALSVSPAACLVVEDSAPGIAAARAAGMTVLGFTAYCGPNSLRRGADAYLSSFEGLGLSELQTLWQGSARLP